MTMSIVGAKLVCLCFFLPFLVWSEDLLPDFSVTEPTLTVSNNGEGLGLSLTLSYTVGDAVQSISQMRLALMTRDCLQYTSDSVLTNDGSYSLVDGVYSTTLGIDTSQFGSSPLVQSAGSSYGLSKGSLSFCTYVETLTADVTPISVEWTASNIVLEYDLTANAFAVTDNRLNKLQDISLNVTTAYRVDACRCDADSTDCDEDPPALEQNGVVYFCLATNSTDVFISTFGMTFAQGGLDDYQVVALTGNGPVSNTFTAVVGEGKIDNPYKVASRLLTRMFFAEDDSFDVFGNAWLQFYNGRRERRLAQVKLRGLQEETLAGKDAGEGKIDLSVALARPQGGGPKASKGGTGAVPYIVLGCAAFSVGFVLVKKMKK
eukprot:CAMPEP_0113304712 /NCGR_PEP_ID=MMETSP0010_2-20120614/4620_1 /TAXON_ID=216773 ORGANISM="Corethron hystrix, Strain 308" /NCGR_SAMPLE_ID=MMETSP0010_2 /ASSEMBLY_ACC=CAM_ASM_000155 /LENGTH=374 /DNA_ID=CAMNT_0000158967 /DNA_START=47 /DNA_END=1171 /DNA_ORIENTATION=+ /assembly_acc=CAM_ASM_000155